MAAKGPIGAAQREVRRKPRKGERNKPGRAKRKLRRGQGKP